MSLMQCFNDPRLIRCQDVLFAIELDRAIVIGMNEGVWLRIGLLDCRCIRTGAIPFGCLVV